MLMFVLAEVHPCKKHLSSCRNCLEDTENGCVLCAHSNLQQCLSATDPLATVRLFLLYAPYLCVCVVIVLSRHAVLACHSSLDNPGPLSGNDSFAARSRAKCSTMSASATTNSPCPVSITLSICDAARCRMREAARSPNGASSRGRRRDVRELLDREQLELHGLPCDRRVSVCAIAHDCAAKPTRANHARSGVVGAPFHPERKERARVTLRPDQWLKQSVRCCRADRACLSPNRTAPKKFVPLQKCQ